MNTTIAGNNTERNIAMKILRTTKQIQRKKVESKVNSL